MLHFIHTYTAASFPGLAANGLWRKGDGLKLMHKPGFVPPDDFNTAAAVGAPLERLLRELSCPFYVDRLQGGLGYTRTYPYDEALLSYYRSLPAGHFLGFQMHEWASNFRSDELRIRALAEKEGVLPEDPAAMADFWKRVLCGELSLFLEAYPPDVWARRALSGDLEKFIENAKALYALRTRETRKRLFPADSYYMAPRIEIENGAGLLLPEVGWQIPNMRVQIALTRGMAASAGIPWGIYYECWQDTADVGFTIPFSLREGDDEWLEDLLHSGNGRDEPPERRERGGSSLSLMERAWLYAYFSGAGYLAEEYGVCNTFRDLKDYALSPYGETKKAFLRFTEAFPQIGTPFVPVAVVLPKEMQMLDIQFGERWLDFPLTDPACPFPAVEMRLFIQRITEIFGSQGCRGNFGHVLKNGGLPAVCDLMYEDMDETLRRYPYLIDLTGKGTLGRRFRNVVSLSEADRLLDGLLPLRAGGGLFTAYNRTEDGWYVLLMNNDGILHDRFQPDVRLPDATVNAALSVANGKTVKTAAGTGSLRSDGGSCSVNLRAGDWLLLEVG